MTKAFAAAVLLFVCCFCFANAAPRAGANPLDTYAAIRVNDLGRLRTLIATASDANARGEFGNTPLMLAAIAGSPEAMTLLLDSGADVNAQNAFGTTALIMSVSDIDKVRVLIGRGANVNVASKQGRSALFVAAMSDASAAIVDLLIAKGADVRATDAFQNSILTAAVAGNDLATITRMIEAGLDVNGAGASGVTPLMESAYHGNFAAAKLLIAKGASAKPVAKLPGLGPGGNPKSGPVALSSLTALHPAAVYGSAALMSALIAAGGDVNARDGRGMTPLMLSVATINQDPAMIQVLLEHGADPAAQSAAGESARDWARKLGAPVGLKLLNVTALPAAAPARVQASAVDAKTAAERGIALLEMSSQKFFDASGCVSCHHQNVTSMATSEARLKGLRFDAQASAARIGMPIGGPPSLLLLERMEVGAPEIFGSALTALAAEHVPPTLETDVMTAHLAAVQSADGSWHILGGLGDRPPTGGTITRTALSIRALKIYLAPARAAEMNARVARARLWLAAATPSSAEERNMQLLGLYWAGDDAAALKPRIDAIMARQQADGAWRMHDGLGSDAYATGQSLYAVAKAGGVAPASVAYQRGVRYLLATQNVNGSWRVTSRSPKFQAYFNSDFPYGGDQWISAWATGWATMALAQTVTQ